MGIELFDHLGEVGQRTGQSIYLVDHDDIDPARLHVGQQALQGRTVGRAARESAVVISCPDQRPMGMGLAAEYAEAASYWASSELNSWSRPESVETRV